MSELIFYGSFSVVDKQKGFPALSNVKNLLNHHQYCNKVLLLN